jgi:hypothetical protein
MGCATIPNIRCQGQYEIDLLAIDLKDPTKRFHIETSVSGSQSFSKLTDRLFDPVKYKQRVGKAQMRRTLGFFVQQKFGKTEIKDKLKEYGFEPSNHRRVIVTWATTESAKIAAENEGIELWDFQEMMRTLAQKMCDKRSYFTDDTFRTINLFVRATRNG